MRFGRQRLDLVTMSGRELQRIEVLSEVLARRRSEISAAAILGLSTRQTRRLASGIGLESARVFFVSGTRLFVADPRVIRAIAVYGNASLHLNGERDTKDFICVPPSGQVNRL